MESLNQEIRLEGYCVEECVTSESFALTVIGHPIVVLGKTKEWVYERMSQLLRAYAAGEVGPARKAVDAIIACDDVTTEIPKIAERRIRELITDANARQVRFEDGFLKFNT